MRGGLGNRKHNGADAVKTSTTDDIKSATAHMTREEHDRWFSHLICYGYAPLPKPKGRKRKAA